MLTLKGALHFLEKVQKENPGETADFNIEYMDCQEGKYRVRHCFDESEWVGWGRTIEDAIIDYAKVCCELLKKGENENF